MAKKKQLKIEEPALKLLTTEQVDKFVVKFLRMKGDEMELKKKMGEELLPKFHAGDRSDTLSKEISDTSLELMRIRESQQHISLVESFTERYRQMTKVMTDQIIQEHNCINEVEKGLASVIAGSYVRYIDNSRRLNNELEGTNITQPRNNYIANLSKQVDRAHRQYLSSIQALKLLKMPALNMKINVDHAFMAQQQDIHVNQNKYD